MVDQDPKPKWTPGEIEAFLAGQTPSFEPVTDRLSMALRLKDPINVYLPRTKYRPGDPMSEPYDRRIGSVESSLNHPKNPGNMLNPYHFQEDMSYNPRLKRPGHEDKYYPPTVAGAKQIEDAEDAVRFRRQLTLEEIAALLAGHTPASRDSREDSMPRTRLIDTDSGKRDSCFRSSVTGREYSGTLSGFDQMTADERTGRRDPDILEFLNYKKLILFPKLVGINEEISYSKDADAVRPARQLSPEVAESLIAWVRSQRAKTA